MREERIKKKIFFIEGASHIRYAPEPEKNVGGSSISLGSLITGLNKDRYWPTALFYYPSPVAEKLREAGYRVQSSRLRPKRSKGTAASPPSLSVETHAALSFYKLFALQILPESRRLGRLFREERPDLVHCNMSLASDLAPIIASRRAGIPCVSHVRDFVEIYWLHKLCSRFVAFLICISEAVRQNYLRQGIRAAKLVRVYNGVDLQDFRPGPEISRPNEAIRVTQVGRLVKWKGQRVLLEAAPLVLRKNPRVQFAIAGDGPERTELAGLAASLEIGGQVSFLGTVADVRPLLADSDIIVLPSLSPEPFGRVVIEAMAMGKPVIATDMGGPREIITPLADGLLVEPDNPARLAEKILFLVNHSGTRRDLGRAARKTVEARFDAQKTVREIEEIYEKAIGSA